MDTLTHALSGALIGRAAAPAGARRVSAGDCMALGFCAAAFPDADVVVSLVSPLAYLYHHRGLTHSLVALPLWALLISWIWSRVRRNPQGFKSYFVVAALALGIHILGDLVTAFGTMVLAPFSDERFALSTTFIIDLWFSGILVAGLVACWCLRRSRLPAIVALLVLCGYVSFQWLQRDAAIEVARSYAMEQGLEDYEASALPRPVSPFNWMVIVRQADAYHYAFVNLRRDRPREAAAGDGFIARLDAVYVPVSSARWERIPRFGDPGQRAIAREAWELPEFGFFRWFAAYPVLAAIEGAGEPSTCVWFRDLRFFTPGRGAWPFVYGMCRRDGGPWQAYQEEDGKRIALQP